MAITAHFIADFSDFTSKVVDAEKALEGMTAQTEKVGTVTAEFGGIASTVFGAVAGGIAAAFSVNQVVEFGQQIMADADALTRMSDQTGIGVEQLQRLKAVATESGNTVEQLTSAVSMMQNRIAEGRTATVEGLARIGLTIDELKGRAPDEQFYAIAKGIQAIEDPTDRARTAIEIFGKSGATILPSLRADIDGITEGATVMSEATVKKLDELGDAWERLKTRVKVAVANMLVPDQTATEQLATMKRNIQTLSDIAAGALPEVKGLALAAADFQKIPTPLAVPGLPTPEMMAYSDALLKSMLQTNREHTAEEKKYADTLAKETLAALKSVQAIEQQRYSLKDLLAYGEAERAQSKATMDRELANLNDLAATRDRIATLEQARGVELTTARQAAALSEDARLMQRYGQIQQNANAEIAALQAVADKKLATAQGDDAISGQRRTAIQTELQLSIEAINTETDAALKATSEIADHATKQIAALQQSFQYRPDLIPTAASLDAAAMRPGSMLGLSRGPMVQSMITPASSMPWNITVNYPIMDDPKALDQITRLVGDGVMSRLTRTGARY